MPTTKPRYAITETAEVARALETARRRWPEDRDRPSRLILRLVHEGERAISPEVEEARAERLAAIRELAGKYPYPEGYLEDLRKDWSE